MCASSRTFFVPDPVERGAHCLADPLGRVFHLVEVGSEIDELHLAPEPLEPPGNQIREFVEPFQVSAARFDFAELLERFEERGSSLSSRAL